MTRARNKYGTSFKTMVITEYFQGASAKELEKKYGVKERTIYSWSKEAREKDNIFVAPKDYVTKEEEDIHKQMQSLEERVIKMEKQLKSIK